MTELTNNGTSSVVVVSGEPVATSTTTTATSIHTQESPLVDSTDGAKASDDSLVGGGALVGTKGALSTASSVADSTESEAPITADGSSSNGSNKRPLCCEDNGEDKPELSAPKLIKL
uniref:Uncharacterized protein n=1 Tax=Anopheles maculatus TaxID=74869 RepID=A0A182SGK3_9DIPT